MNIVTLLEELVNTLLEAEEDFYQNPKDFYTLEKKAKSTTEAFTPPSFKQEKAPGW